MTIKMERMMFMGMLKFLITIMIDTKENLMQL